MSYGHTKFEVDLGELCSPSRKPRKSWFDKEAISAARAELQQAREESGDYEYEVLRIEHFSRPPKIDFGDTLQGEASKAGIVVDLCCLSLYEKDGFMCHFMAALCTGRRVASVVQVSWLQTGILDPKCWLYILGKCKRRYLRVVNERESPARVTIQKCPDHFTISQTEPFIVYGNSFVLLSILWEPKEEGGQHGVIKFHIEWEKTFTLYMSVFGKCQADPKLAKVVKKKKKPAAGKENRPLVQRPRQEKQAEFKRPYIPGTVVKEKPKVKTDWNPGVPFQVPLSAIKQATMAHRRLLSDSSVRVTEKPQGQGEVVRSTPVRVRRNLESVMPEDREVSEQTDSQLREGPGLPNPDLFGVSHSSSVSDSTLCLAHLEPTITHGSDDTILSETSPLCMQHLDATTISERPCDETLTMTLLDQTRVPAADEETVFVAPNTSPVFLTPTLKRSHRKSRRRSNTYSKESPITPRELVPSADLHLDTPARQHQTPLRAALAASMRQRYQAVPSTTRCDLEDTPLRMAHPELSTPELAARLNDDEIGPLTPVTEIMPQGVPVTRRSTYGIEEGSNLTNTPEIYAPFPGSPDSSNVQGVSLLSPTPSSPQEQLVDSPLLGEQVKQVIHSPTPGAPEERSFHSATTRGQEVGSLYSPGASAVREENHCLRSPLATCQDDKPPSSLKEPEQKEVTLPELAATRIIRRQPQGTQAASAPVAFTIPPGAKRKSLDEATTPPKFTKRNDTSRRGKHANRLAVRTLVLKPNSKTRQPLLHSSQNRFYDHRWMEKQEIGFTRWLNFVLTPQLENEMEDTLPQENSLVLSQIGGVVKPAVSKETQSLRLYVEMKRMNQLRQKSCQLFHSEDVASVLLRVEKAIEDGKLGVRADRAIHADIGLRSQLLSVLMSYTPLWLRIGLETVFGEVIETRSLIDTNTLKSFIMSRVLSDPWLAAQYSHPNIANLHKDGYQQAIGKHILGKLMLLIYTLDRAKTARLIDYDPCLFYPQAEYKASKDLLLFISRELLTGVGDITRQLNHLGYKVSYHQKTLDEYAFCVSNLATDLKDGACLVRAVEILTKDYSLSSHLRIPATTLTNKKHNVQVAFTKMTSDGVSLTNVKAEDVVSGHREKTLQVLWALIHGYQIDRLIDRTVLSDEIGRLRKTGTCADLTQEQLADVTLRGQLLLWTVLVCSHHGVVVNNFGVSFTDGRALCYIIHHYQPTLIPAEEICERTTLNSQQLPSDERGDLTKNEKKNFKLLHKAVLTLGGIPILSKSMDMCSTVPDDKTTCLYVTYICARLLDLRDETWAARVIQRAWRRLLARRELQSKLEKVRAQKVRLQRQTRASCIIQGWWRAALQKKWEREANARRHQAAHRLQLWWSAARITRKQRGRFLATRRATICLQRRWRSVIRIRAERAEEIHRETAAVTVQRWWRDVWHRLVERQRLERLEKAALTIQRGWRSVVIMRNCRQVYTRTLNATRTLQCWWTGVLHSLACRAAYLQKRQAVVVLQRWWRGVQMTHKCREAYLLQREAAVIVQRGWRGRLLMRRCLAAFQQQKSSAITIQTWWRGVCLVRENRGEFLAKGRAVGIIQDWWRNNKLTQKLQSNYQCQRCAAITVQRHWRAYKLAKQCQVEYQNKRLAACAVQSWWRSMMAMKVCLQDYQRKVASVRKLQEWWRSIIAMRTQHAKYQQTVQAVKVVQVRWRSVRIMRQVKDDFLLKRRCASRIQSWYQSVLAIRRCRDAYVKSQTATRKLQQWWRSMLLMKADRTQYIRIRQAARVVQTHWKALLAMRQCQTVYNLKHGAVIQLQLWWRSIRAMRAQRAEFQRQKLAAVTIQEWFRLALTVRRCQQRYNRTLAAVRLIQRSWRSFCIMRNCQQKYLATRLATLRIQHWWVAMRNRTVCRDQYQAKRNATINLQAWWRSIMSMRTYRVIYHQKRNAAIVIQTQWRATLAMRARRAAYQQKILAAQRIQEQWRNVQLMRADRARYRAKRAAIQSIQQRWKSRQEMIHCRNDYQMIRNAARVIQTWWRSVIMMQKCRVEFQQKISTSLMIQRWWRSVQRMRACRVVYLRKIAAVRKIQEWWRSQILVKKCQYELKQKLVAVGSIQGWWRSVIAMRQCRGVYHRQKKAVTAVSVWWRSLMAMHADRQVYQQIRRATLCLQTRWRSIRLTRIARADYLRKRDATTAIQRHWRATKLARRCQVDYQNKRNATITIQKWWNASLKTRRCREEYVTYRCAVLKIQRWWISHQLMRRIQTEFLQKSVATRVIQTWWRQKLREKSVRRETEAVLCLQHWWRSVALARRCQATYQKNRLSALVIQKWWRAVTVCRARHLEFRQRTAAARALQSWWKSMLKMKRCREEYLIQIGAALTIQRAYRDYRAHLHYSARVIQAVYRNYRCRQLASRNIQSVIAIQSWWRMCIVRTQYLAHLESMKLQVTAAIIIQRRVRTWLEKRHQERVETAAIRIQMVWRGYRVRRKRKSQAWHGIRERLTRANATASPELTLGYRTTRALCGLCTNISVKKLFECLRHLVAVTQWSPSCRLRVAEPAPLTMLCYIISICNRSEPAKEILYLTMTVLHNLATDPATVLGLSRTDNLSPSLLEVMTIYQESSPRVFEATANVFISICENVSAREAILDGEFITKVTSLYKLTERKLAMAIKVKSKKVVSAQVNRNRMHTLMKLLGQI